MAYDVSKALEAFTRKRHPVEAELIYQDFLVERIGELLGSKDFNPLSVHPDIFQAICGMMQHMIELSLLVDNDEPDALLKQAIKRAQLHAANLEALKTMAKTNQETLDRVRREGTLSVIVPKPLHEVRAMMEKLASERTGNSRTRKPGGGYL